MTDNCLKNSIMIPDQSGFQQICFMLSQNNPIKVFEFFEEQQISIYIPSEAKIELGFQAYGQSLFSGVSSESSTVFKNSFPDEESFTFSRANGSLTPTCLQQNGPTVTMVESSVLYSETFQGQWSLWDASPMMQKMLKNKRSLVDPANIRLAISLREQGKRVFIFTNDQLQIKQLKFNKIKYLRPDNLIIWMHKEGYINSQKATWNFRKRREHDKKWTEPNTSFKNILHRIDQ